VLLLCEVTSADFRGCRIVLTGVPGWGRLFDDIVATWLPHLKKSELYVITCC